MYGSYYLCIIDLASSRDRYCFLQVELEIVPFDERHGLVGAQTCVALRRIAPTDDRHRDAISNLCHGVSDEPMPLLIRRHFLVVVQHQHAVIGQSREQLSEKSSAEARHVR